MSLYKRNKGGNWWIDTTLATGQRVRQSTGTKDKEQAKKLLRTIEDEAWDIVRNGGKPKRKWTEAVTQWIKEKANKKSLDDDKCRLRWLDKYLRDVYLEDIDRDLLNYITDEKLEEDVSETTVNRYLEIIRAILIKARDDWEWLDKTPKVRMLPKKKGRVRWLTQEEAERLLYELPEHLKAMALFTLATGLRARNVTQLKWTQIDLINRRAWVEASDSKTGKPIGVALNEEAINVLKQQRGKNPEYVFTYQGKPVTRPSNGAWSKALARAEIDDFRWHDLRHTWASWLVQNGTPLNALKEMGGWTSMDMVMRYAHLSPDHLSQYAEDLPKLKVA